MVVSCIFCSFDTMLPILSTLKDYTLFRLPAKQINILDLAVADTTHSIGTLSLEVFVLFLSPITKGEKV